MSGSTYGKMRIWNTGSAESCVQTMRGHTGRDSLNVVVFSGNGKIIFSGARDETVLVWDAENGVVVGKYTAQRYIVDRMGFSADGNEAVFLSACYVQKTVYVVKVDKMDMRGDGAHASKGRVSHIAYRGKGKRIVTACDDGCVRIWDAVVADELFWSDTQRTVLRNGCEPMLDKSDLQLSRRKSARTRRMHVLRQV